MVWHHTAGGSRLMTEARLGKGCQLLCLHMNMLQERTDWSCNLVSCPHVEV